MYISGVVDPENQEKHAVPLSSAAEQERSAKALLLL
jgi:hypothetical protein